MKGINHLIIVVVGIAGLFIGGFLIDVIGHKGSLSDMWKCFWGQKTDSCLRHNWLHQPVVILSVAVFSLCLGFGLLIHYVMDLKVMSCLYG